MLHKINVLVKYHNTQIKFEFQFFRASILAARGQINSDYTPKKVKDKLFKFLLQLQIHLETNYAFLPKSYSSKLD